MARTEFPRLRYFYGVPFFDSLETAVVAVFVVSAIIQMGYAALFFSRLIHALPAAIAPTDVQGVSVIVCAHNELANLRKLIPALLAQQYPLFEIIIVDDRSNDECYDFLLFESFKHANMRLVRINRTPDHVTPKKYALTLGIKAAKYEIILLTDADCMPQSGQWIDQMQQKLTSGKQIVLGYSPYAKTGGLLNFMIRYETFYTAVQYFSFTLAKFPYMGVGRNLAYHKTLFIENKGFRKHLRVVGGDDDLFINQVATAGNVAICLDESSQMVSIPKNTFPEWFRQKKRHLSVGKYYKLQHRILLGIAAVTQIVFWVSFWSLVGMQAAGWVVVGLFLMRIVTLTWVLKSAIPNLDKTIQWFFIPVFDFLYVIYYFSIGFTAFFAKRIRWN